MDFFGTDEIFALMRSKDFHRVGKLVSVFGERLNHSKAPLEVLAATHIEITVGGSDSASDPVTLDVTDLVDAHNRCLKFVKFLDYTLNFKVHHVDSKPSDVSWFSSYKGKLSFEKSVRDFIKDDTWWGNATLDIVKTATTSILLRPKFNSVSEVLAKNIEHLNWANQRTLWSDLKELRIGMRKQELLQVEAVAMSKAKQFAESVTGKASDQAKSLALRSEQVITIADGLRMFVDSPGVADSLQELTEWMTKHVKVMALNDLNELMDTSIKNGAMKLADLDGISSRVVGRKILEEGDSRSNIIQSVKLAINAFFCEANFGLTNKHMFQGCTAKAARVEV